jgi:hypothetical protein
MADESSGPKSMPITPAPDEVDRVIVLDPMRRQELAEAKGDSLVPTTEASPTAEQAAARAEADLAPVVPIAGTPVPPPTEPVMADSEGEPKQAATG